MHEQSFMQGVGQQQRAIEVQRQRNSVIFVHVIFPQNSHTAMTNRSQLNYSGYTENPPG
jgi:hypothetical protein